MQKFQHFNQIVEIGERLAGAHDNQRVDFLIRGAQEIVDKNNFAEHFARRQISFEPVERRRAEFATHLAADLRRNADAVAIIVAHKNCFDSGAVAKLQQKFCRKTVGGIEAAENFRRGNFVAPVQIRAKIFGKVGHIVERFSAALVEPGGYLFCAEFRQRFEFELQFRQCQSE